jgi:hypothetical protein
LRASQDIYAADTIKSNVGDDHYELLQT